MSQSCEQLFLCIQSSVLICLSPFLTRPSKVVDFLKPQIPVLWVWNICLADCWKCAINYKILIVQSLDCLHSFVYEVVVARVVCFVSCLYIQRTFSNISCYFACGIFCFLSLNSQNSDTWNEECLGWVCKSTPNLWTAFPSVPETFQKYDKYDHLWRAARGFSPDVSHYDLEHAFCNRKFFMSLSSFAKIAKCESWKKKKIPQKLCRFLNPVFCGVCLQHGQKIDHNNSFQN